MEQTLHIEKSKNEEKELEYKLPKIKFSYVPYIYILPSIALFVTFVYYPFIRTIYLSMTLTNSRGKAVEFVGVENYLEIFKSPEFLNSLKITFKFVPMIAIPSIIIGLILAILANNKVKGRSAYEVMFAMPMAVASAPAAIMWSMIFHPTIGILNYLLNKEIGWLTDERWALIAVAVVTIWLNIGINFIFLLTGLKSVPQEIYESSEIDGAGFFQKLFKITLPMVSPTLFFVVFINIISSFQAFGQVKLLTGGGPGNSTNVLVHSIYREAFLNNRFDIASAESIVLFLIMLVVTLIQFRFEKKGVHYQ